jgi:hypothetical protein
MKILKHAIEKIVLNHVVHQMVVIVKKYVIVNMDILG